MGLAAVVIDPLALTLLKGFGWLAGILELDLDPPPALQEPVIRGAFAPRIHHLPAKPSIGFGPGDDSPLDPGFRHQSSRA